MPQQKILKEVTPAHLRCVFGECPAVYLLNDGNLLLVGKKPPAGAAEEVQHRLGSDGSAIVINPEMVRDLGSA